MLRFGLAASLGYYFRHELSSHLLGLLSSSRPTSACRFGAPKLSKPCLVFCLHKPLTLLCTSFCDWNTIRRNLVIFIALMTTTTKQLISVCGFQWLFALLARWIYVGSFSLFHKSLITLLSCNSNN